VVAHGAVGTLTVACICLSHKMDLREVAPRFPTADEILDDIGIRRLIVEFSDYAEAIATIIDVE